jgi:uncharacterized protein YkwD
MRNPLQTLKHLFIPHEGNGHQPHMLRTSAMLVLIAIAFLAEAGLFMRQSGVLQRSTFFAQILDSVLVDQTNQNRVVAALPTLRSNPILDQAAALKAADMAAKSYFAHTSPEGLTPWYWFDRIGYKYEYAGENLAVDFTDSEDVTNAWMKSPLHRANILNQNFTDIGIAQAHGSYQGHDAVFVVQLFGKPAPLSAGTGVAVALRPLVPVPAPTPAPNPILGASTEQPAPTPPLVVKQPLPQETFVAIENVTPPAPATSTPAATAGSTNTVHEAPVISPVARILANPRRVVDALTLFLIFLMVVALVLKIRHVGFAYPHLVMNGLTVLIVMTAILAMNHYVLLTQAQVY